MDTAPFERLMREDPPDETDDVSETLSGAASPTLLSDVTSVGEQLLASQSNISPLEGAVSDQDIAMLQ